MASEPAEHWPLWNVTTRTHCMPVVFIIPPWLLSVTRVTPVAPLLSIFSFVLHSACYYVSSSFTAERHVLLVLALPTSARDTGLGNSVGREDLSSEQHLRGTGKLSYYSSVFPTLVPGFPKWAVDAHSLSVLVCIYYEPAQIIRKSKFGGKKKTSCFIGQPYPG